MEIKKVPVIELMEYNVLLSLFDFFYENFKDKKIHNKNIEVVQSFFDRHLPYNTPSLSIEILHRKNRSIGFGNYWGEINSDEEYVEFEGLLMEYRVQLNVYSNTRGENHKWCSLLDNVLVKGEDGIKINTYNDNGTIKEENLGIIQYDYASDVKNNNQIPNIKTYDFHTIYEVKMSALQLYKINYGFMEIENIIGILKGSDFSGRV